MRKTGTYESIGDIKFFIPNALPPQQPPFNMDIEMITLYGDAMHHLGQLKEMTSRLPDVDHFIRAYVYKEALLSSAIEDINTTLLDIFTHSLVATKPDKNTQLVMNYTKALYKALSMIQKDNLPIIARVILAAHKELMSGGDGDRFNPGNYRRQTVKVGNLVPPPAPKIHDLMSDLEKYINSQNSIPTIIKAGLVHVQFETIHPFLDGNGRIGRLLIVLMLVEKGILSDPIIYPSYYFKKRNFDYYKLLDGVRINGDFESWIKYYLAVMKDSAIDACRRAQDIEQLLDEITDAIYFDEEIGIKGCEMRIEAIPIFFKYPVISISKLQTQLKVSYNTASKIIGDFIRLGFLAEEGERERGRLFRFKTYFEILEKEYD